MKALILFDSNYGNTKIIAEKIAKELETKAVPVSTFSKDKLKGIEFIVVGSPIISWKPSEKMGEFLDKLNKDDLKGMKVATFDTRVKLFIHGDAMIKIANKLKEAGAEVVAKSHPFYVKGTEGPLLDGETDKAAEWARSLKTQK